MVVVVGLGNPGARYRMTRHNCGFRVVDRLAERWGVGLARRAHSALVGEARRDGTRVLLVKPQTFMNASGQSAASLKRFFHLAAGDFVVVHDDLDLPLGRIKLRYNGGSGGHRGVESVVAALGDPEFLRVKVGIGRPPAGLDPVSYVLAQGDAEETKRLAEAEARAAAAIETLLAEGPERAMNTYNQREGRDAGTAL